MGILKNFLEKRQAKKMVIANATNEANSMADKFTADKKYVSSTKIPNFYSSGSDTSMMTKTEKQEKIARGNIRKQVVATRLKQFKDKNK